MAKQHTPKALSAIQSAIHGRLRRAADDGDEEALQTLLAMAEIVDSPESDSIKAMGLMEDFHRKWSSDGFEDDLSG